jgi:hypothetical protein
MALMNEQDIVDIGGHKVDTAKIPGTPAYRAANPLPDLKQIPGTQDYIMTLSQEPAEQPVVPLKHTIPDQVRKDLIKDAVQTNLLVGAVNGSDARVTPNLQVRQVQKQLGIEFLPKDGWNEPQRD